MVNKYFARLEDQINLLKDIVTTYSHDLQGIRKP